MSNCGPDLIAFGRREGAEDRKTLMWRWQKGKVPDVGASSWLVSQRSKVEG